jgi:hypothetical protein
VDLADIRRLAARGIAAFPPTSLESAAEWLWDYAEATGDARYSSLSQTVAMIWAAFEDSSEQMWTTTVEAIDAELATSIPGILDENAAADAAQMARTLRESVAAILRESP